MSLDFERFPVLNKKLSMALKYSKKVIEHFLHPKHWGKMKYASGIGNTVNLACGDIMKIYIKVDEKKREKYIEDLKFETLGCGAAIAASDMICDLVKGKTLKEAKKIGFKDIANELDSLPIQKIHCARLAETALNLAIKDYEKRKK